MSELTMGGLTTLLRECAGEEEALKDAGAMDADFSDLGYDSIALLEIAGRIQVQYGVVLADDAVFEARTPRALLDLVNRTLREAV